MCVFQLMSTHLEVRFKVSAPGGVLAAEYNASNEEIVAVGAGFCGVSNGKTFIVICNG